MPDEKLVQVAWYEHDCPWLSKYCDENHLVTAMVPESVLASYRTAKSFAVIPIESEDE